MSGRSTPSPLPQQRFTFYGPRDFAKLPRTAWLVKDVLPTQGIASIFGPSGSGKSFLLIDLIASIVTGEPWFGHDTVKCKVLCVVLEGQAGFRQRIRAWEEHNGQFLPTEQTAFMFDSFRLNVDDDVADLDVAIKAAQGLNVVFIDTLNRAAPNADENNSQQMGMLISAASKLQASIDGLVVLVHHTGKDQSRGMRGHSSLYAAMDAAIEVSRQDNKRSWKLLKAKDGKDGDVFAFDLVPFEFTEADGHVVNSCVVEALPETHSFRLASTRPKGANERIVYEAVLTLLTSSLEIGKGNAPPEVPCVEVNFAINQTKSLLPVEPKRQSERTKAAIEQLVRSGHLECEDKWLWEAKSS